MRRFQGLPLAPVPVHPIEAQMSKLRFPERSRQKSATRWVLV
jgi:hypothetical protein